MATARASLQSARRVVVKVGSRALSSAPGLPANLIAHLAESRQALESAARRFVLVLPPFG